MQVKLSVFAAYVSSCRLVPVCLAVAWYIAYLTAQITTNVWLSIWSNDNQLVNGTNSKDTSLRDLRLGVYGGLGIGQGQSTVYLIPCLLNIHYMTTLYIKVTLQ